MKPVRRADSSSQSCSCTSCIYKSESEQPCIRKYVAHGSRISRLYFGKYIPLRERKLLTRLARTRAVYDDLRARLISDSTISLEQNADLRPGKHHRVVKPVDSRKSGAILEIIDIIDKGAALDPKKLSDCCSCCSCSSESKILGHKEKIKRGKKDEHGGAGQTGTGEGVMAITHERKHGKAGQTGMRKEVYERTTEKRHGKTKQSGTGEGEYATYETYERDFGKKVPGAIGQRYNKREVHFKAKKIRSEPCTCTFKFSGLIKKHSKSMLRKTQPPLEQPFLNTEQQVVVKKAKKNLARKSIQKYKELRDKLDQDMKKLNESKENLKKSLQLHAKKSLEQSKKIKKKIKQNIETGVRRSMQVVKNLRPKEVLEPIENPNIETEFKIKKDSLVKFKDHLKKKAMMKDWECNIECEPDVCVPEECFKVIKLRRSHKRKSQQDRKLSAGYEMINKEAKIGGVPLSGSSSGVQTKQIAITKATHTKRKKQKPMLRDMNKNQVMEKHLTITTEHVRRVSGKKGEDENIKKTNICECPRIVVSSGQKELYENVSPEAKPFHDIEKKDNIKTKSRRERGLVVKKRPSRGRQAVRIKSSFSFDIEFYKNRPETKLSQSSEASGIHMHAQRGKRRKVHRHTESKSSVESSQGTPQNLKTRLIQTDKHGKGQQQGQVITKVSNVKTNTNYGTKSVSSMTNNAATTDKNISKEIKQKGRLSQAALLPARPDGSPSQINRSYSQPKQAVRIGSTFSFDIEFYKKGVETPAEVEVEESPPPQKSIKPIKEKLQHIHSKQVQVKHKLVKVKGTSAKAYNHAKNTLHRCLCTLKLNKHTKTNKETKKKTSRPAMINRSVETKKNYREERPKIYDLLPYECEPGICIPGECDPIACKKILDLRHQKFKRKSIGSHTDSRKTKSTSSILSRPFTSAKTVQSSIVSTKEGGTGAPRRYKNNLNSRRKELVKTTLKASDRQAVRIGSTFSFNIEFYKDKPNLAVREAEEPSMSSRPPEIYKYQKFEKQTKVNDKRNKSMFTQVMKMDKYIGPSLKNCLCTLKLHRKKIPKAEKKVPMLTTDTQTLGEAPIRESVDRGTRTKKKHHYKLLPYECEPYTCVPGECDPYICLEKIKRRELNTRNIGAFTDKPEMQSISSVTEDSFTKSEATLVQPKLFPKGTHMKANYFKGHEGRPRLIGEHFDKASKSKQAVRVGSSFKFSIEFSKQSPEPVMVTKYPKIKPSPKVYQNNNTDRGITVTKVRVNHGDTQSLEPRQVNRASLVRPMLKRCFCTLNLEKKTKQQYHKTGNFGPKVYTIGRATTMKTELFSQSFSSQMNANLQLIEPKTKIISISTSSFLLNKYVKSLKSKYETEKLYSTFNILNHLKEPAVKKSNLSMKINIVGEVLPYEKSWAGYNKEPPETISPAYTSEESYDYSKLFNQSCHQNLRKLTGISRYLERSFCTMNVHISNPGKIHHKLKPYECEPGICVPGECNPYECKKLIMKRFAKHVHKSSGTKSKSISSYTASNTGSDSKSTQMQKHIRNHSRATVSQKYKHSPKIHTHEQSEGRPRAIGEDFDNASKSKQAVRIKSSFSFELEFYKKQALEKPFRQNRYDTVDKSMQNHSHKIPGKDKKSQSALGGSLYKSTASMTKRCFCTLKLQKRGRLQTITSRNIKIGTKNHIDPVYLKELGINTVHKRMNSGSSMTSEGKYKSHASGATPVTTRHKSTKAIEYIQNTQNDSYIENVPSVRSAVRIGSNFSFNIEFFKDMPGELNYKEPDLQERIIHTKEIKAYPSSSKKSFSHKLTVTEKPLNEESTMTAKLHTTHIPKSHDNKTFKDRCFCILGLRNKEKLEQRSINKTTTTSKLDKFSKGDRTSELSNKTAEKPTNTKVKHKVYTHHLEPYECEPGICIPGQCDPYQCDKIIQQRLAKQVSRKLETDTIRRNSTSSGSENYKSIRNERSQAQSQTRGKIIQHQSKNIAPSSSKTFNDKNLVRIGSNFSFNIEFYKENVNGNATKPENIREVKAYPSKVIQYDKRPLENVSKISGTKTVSAQSKKSQFATKTKTLGINPLLKRCFCTLKLMNKTIHKIDQTEKLNKLDIKPITATKSVETQLYKPLNGQILQHELNRHDLSPYECEPFVCTPGECDPVECLKRIKRRQQHTRESSTITKYPKRKSIGSVGTKTRNEYLQVKRLHKAPDKSIQKTSYVEKSWPEKSYNQSRQAVRIGSNFSFNIEFFKERGDGLTHQYQPCNMKHNVDAQGIHPRHKTSETTTALRNKTLSTSKKIQSDRPKSAHSNVGTILKRCICTLKLNKAGKQENLPSTKAISYKVRGTSTQRLSAIQHQTNKSVRILEPYECEPYVCVPGECDPYECLKRIQRRQVRDFGTDYKHHVKDSATNSLRKPLTRSTRAQYHQKRKFGSRGTSIVTKRTRPSKEISQLPYDSSPNTNRQMVRIGSNFSFNIEIFKDHGTGNTEREDLKAETASNMTKIQLKQPEKVSTKSKGSISALRRRCDKKSQCSTIKRQLQSSIANTEPKRCFCTLKLLKKPKHSESKDKHTTPTIPTRTKATETKIKYSVPQELGVYECPPLMCIPGECNPYECLEKIKKRDIMRKSRTVGTRAGRTSIASVQNRGLSLRTHKVQSQITKRRNVVASTPFSEPQSEIFKSNRQNKCAVRIGSNFNFNVEFFKHKLQPAVAPVSMIVNARNNEEDSESYSNQHFTAGTRNFGHSYKNKTKIKDQGSDAGNSLKRCFCTLQLRNPSGQKSRRVTIGRPEMNARYPQTLTVGRVMVEPCCYSPKMYQTKKENKARSTCTDPKLLQKTVGTKTAEKYLDFTAYCNPINCHDDQKRMLKDNCKNDMQTILPFSPSKFRKESKTYVSAKKNNYTPSQNKGKHVHNPSDKLIVCTDGRRLTAKKSKKSIAIKSLERKSDDKDNFFCRCIRFFSRSSKTICKSPEHDNRSTIKQRRPDSRAIPEMVKLAIRPKKAKSFGDECPFICHRDIKATDKRHSYLQSGDVNGSIIKEPKTQKKQGGGKFVTFADNKMVGRKANKSVYSKSETHARLCYYCSVNDCPLNKGDSPIPGNKKAPSYSESPDACNYCACCKRKVDTDEIIKGSGDRRSITLSQYKEDIDKCPCDNDFTTIGKERRHSLSKKSKKSLKSDKESKKSLKINLSQKPEPQTEKSSQKAIKVDDNKQKCTFEMRLDQDSLRIINPSEVKKKMEEIYGIKDIQKKSKETKKKYSCICCECLKKIKTSVPTTTTPTLTNKIKDKTADKPPQKKIGPCTCGSTKCAVDSFKKKYFLKCQRQIKKRPKICICGTDICAEEYKRIKKKKEKADRIARLKVQSAHNTKERRAIDLRIKKEEEGDEHRRIKRLKKNKELERRVKEYKNASDVLLAVDSIIDISKLGISSLAGGLRYTSKALSDPKVTYERFAKKYRGKDPVQLLQADYKESDVAATLHRLRMRFCFMKKVQSLKETLEGNPFTHFILHLADKNPKTRKFHRKPVRRLREPLDFQCSLYMASLRRRPHLSVYLKWPRFYPHFLSVLNIWKQFTDIMLFLLAAVVWSPCILCMEGCRALMCCFFCTG